MRLRSEFKRSKVSGGEVKKLIKGMLIKGKGIVIFMRIRLVCD
nr:hypothetical protein [uncultured Lachnoclostridium sp.]